MADDVGDIMTALLEYDKAVARLNSMQRMPHFVGAFIGAMRKYREQTGGSPSVLAPMMRRWIEEHQAEWGR
jgi:hypothetical protein